MTLLIALENPLETMWSPPPPSLDATFEMFNAHEVVGSHEFMQRINSMVIRAANIVYILAPTPIFPNTPSLLLTTLAMLGVIPPPIWTYLLPAFHAARLFKTPNNMGLIKKANAISSRVQEVVMRVLGKVGGWTCG